jgi:hypothetical protein
MTGGNEITVSQEGKPNTVFPEAPTLILWRTLEDRLAVEGLLPCLREQIAFCFAVQDGLQPKFLIQICCLAAVSVPNKVTSCYCDTT